MSSLALVTIRSSITSPQLLVAEIFRQLQGMSELALPGEGSQPLQHPWLSTAPEQGLGQLYQQRGQQHLAGACSPSIRLCWCIAHTMRPCGGLPCQLTRISVLTSHLRDSGTDYPTTCLFYQGVPTTALGLTITAARCEVYRLWRRSKKKGKRWVAADGSALVLYLGIVLQVPDIKKLLSH
ncbi:hypothetical protein QYF61_021424 [Mycteria americana]|uniref:Uncharacterized protein n=1 Tax=Mycteria americana TaxID=33587 RepID=A0AAN7NEB3_MYCAM|nr:hypothetical protein QYF61_021424 [Mycteria americana]